jgi:hypothetical protein
MMPVTNEQKTKIEKEIEELKNSLQARELQLKAELLRLSEIQLGQGRNRNQDQISKIQKQRNDTKALLKKSIKIDDTMDYEAAQKALDDYKLECTTLLEDTELPPLSLLHHSLSDRKHSLLVRNLELDAELSRLNEEENPDKNLINVIQQQRYITNALWERSIEIDEMNFTAAINALNRFGSECDNLLKATELPPLSLVHQSLRKRENELESERARLENKYRTNKDPDTGMQLNKVMARHKLIDDQISKLDDHFRTHKNRTVENDGSLVNDCNKILEMNVVPDKTEKMIADLNILRDEVIANITGHITMLKNYLNKGSSNSSTTEIRKFLGKNTSVEKKTGVIELIRKLEENIAHLSEYDFRTHKYDEDILSGFIKGYDSKSQKLILKTVDELGSNTLTYEFTKHFKEITVQNECRLLAKAKGNSQQLQGEISASVDKMKSGKDRDQIMKSGKDRDQKKDSGGSGPSIT